MRLVPGMDSRRATIESSSDLKIELGSYIMSMPTREGRTALVIFPPRNESRGDIEYMLGDDKKVPSLHKLRHFMLTRNGQDCRLVMKKVTEEQS